jgi:hypothetical protein
MVRVSIRPNKALQATPKSGAPEFERYAHKMEARRSIGWNRISSLQRITDFRVLN